MTTKQKKKYFSSKENKKKALLALLYLTILLLIILLAITPFSKIFSNPLKIKDFILGFGIYSAIAFIVILVAKSILIIPPSPPIIIAGGFIFGPYLGTLYSLLGVLMGATVVFFTTKLFGRPFIESILSKNFLNKIDENSETFANTLFFIYLIPVIPHDSFTYLAGLTNIKYKHLLIIVALGRIPSILFLNILGHQFTEISTLFIIILIVLVIIGLIFFILKKDNIKNKIKNIESRIYKK